MAGESASQNETGYDLVAEAKIQELLAKRQKSAAVAEGLRRKVSLGGGLAMGLIGLLGGTSEALDTMENKELAWALTLAGFVAVVLATGGYLVWRALGAAASNDTATLAAIDSAVAALVTAAGAIRPSGQGAAGAAAAAGISPPAGDGVSGPQAAPPAGPRGQP